MHLPVFLGNCKAHMSNLKKRILIILFSAPEKEVFVPERTQAQLHVLYRIISNGTLGRRYGECLFSLNTGK